MVVINCPQCRASNLYDGTADTVICIRCGLKIDIMDIAGYKGYLRSGYLNLELLDFDSAYEDLEQAVRLMDDETFLDERTEMIDRIVTALCSITPVSDINGGIATDLFRIVNRRDTMEEGTFSHTILRQVSERLAKTDPDSLPFILDEFEDIAFSSIVTVPAPKPMLFAAGMVLYTISLIKAHPSNDFDVQDKAREVVERYSAIYNHLFIRLRSEVNARSDEDLDANLNCWAD